MRMSNQKKSVSWTKTNSSRRTDCVRPRSSVSSPNRSTGTRTSSTSTSRNGRTRTASTSFPCMYLEMTYCINGVPYELAPDPVWMGSFVRCTLAHPELFQYKCPKCWNTVLPFRYVGSPLSGRVDLEGYCDCGWRGFEMVSGWFKRGEVLRVHIESDRLRHGKYKPLHPRAEPANIDELLAWLVR